MGKYYVFSGRMQTVIDAKDHQDAAVKSLQKVIKSQPKKKKTLTEVSQMIKVSEIGFSVYDDDMLYMTINILKLIDDVY